MEELKNQVLLFRTNVGDAVIFDAFSTSIAEFAQKYGYSSFIDNHEKYDETKLESWLLLKNVIEITDEVRDRMTEKVIILQTRGFKPNDISKVASLINEALLKYKIGVLLTNEPVKLITSDEFFEHVEKDLGILSEVRERKAKEFNITEPEKKTKKMSRSK